MDLSKLINELILKSENHSSTLVGLVTVNHGRQKKQLLPIPPNAGSECDILAGSQRYEIGDIVEASVVSKGRQRGWKVRVERVISSKNDSRSTLEKATEVLLESFDIPRVWDKAITETQFPSEVPSEAYKHRKDLRDIALVTIDGKDAKDFDDAVYCKANQSGWQLIVAIADVAEYVKPESLIDIEAQKRGTSVYLPQHVVPMLPEALSNGICSLRPFEDRLAVVCDMQVNSQGEVESSRFYEAVIRSHARLTYGEVADFLRTGGAPNRRPDVKESLTVMADLQQAMTESSNERGSITFETLESHVVVQNGEPISVGSTDRNQAHIMIEMAMIAANVEAARFLETNQLSPMYRIHEAPSRQDLDRVRGSLKQRNISVPTTIEKPSQMQALLNAIRSRMKDPKIWEVALLTAMPQARYGIERKGHFGLALESYAHFTSPIRRYPDLIVHRMIKSVLSATSAPAPTDGELTALGLELSICERRAISVERQVQSWLKCVLVQKKFRKIVSGVVVSVQPFGLFVELEGFDVSGLIHVSQLGIDFYEFINGELVGEATNETFAFGKHVEVEIASAKPPVGRIELVLADGGLGRPGSKQNKDSRVTMVDLIRNRTRSV